MSPIARTLAGLAVVAAIAVAGVIITQDDPYVVRVPMDDAAGLRDGSEVSRGGVSIGKVALAVDRDDRVEATLEIKREHAPIPRDAKVAIVSANLLGMKSVEIVGGNDRRPAADGSELSADQVEVGTDLDQVLNVLDADTRTRLAIVLNELGDAVAGRKGDIRIFTEGLPPAFVDATQLVDQLVTDNQTLADLVTRTDSAVAEITARRQSLNHLIDSLGGAMETVADRRTSLRQTLAEAPPTLDRLREFLVKLQATTVPLEPAARRLSAVAPALQGLLNRVEPLRVAALPTLATATDVAPDLTRLADGATPVLRRARRPVRQLEDLAVAMPPLTRTIAKSSNNLLGTIDNWTRAIQFRDGMSHVFRGEASASPDLILSAITRLTSGQSRRGNPPKVPRPGTQRPPIAPIPAAALPQPPAKRPQLTDLVKKPVQTVNDIVQQVVGPHLQGTTTNPDAVNNLLDYLLKP